MDKAKDIFKTIGALLPVIYCGGLVYYFIDSSGSVRNTADIGLGPTVLGLTIVGLLLCIPLFLKVSKLFRPRSPDAGGDGPDIGGGGKGGFDPDAAIARYVASRSSQAVSTPAVPAPRGPAKPAGFGRKGR